SAQVTHGIINPPSMTDAFLYRDYGDPQVPDSGLVLIALHAVRSGQAPGNRFVDLSEEQQPVVRIAAGDALEVDGQHYRVTGTEVLTKVAATHNSRLWDD